MKIRKGLITQAIIALVVLTRGASAATIYWDGTSSVGWDSVANWSTASNATTPNPVAVPGAADTAQFNISTANSATTVFLNATQAINEILPTSTGTVNLRGGGVADQTLELGAGGITKSTSGTLSIGSTSANQNVALSLTANQSWTANSGTIRPDGSITVPSSLSNTARVLTLTGTGTGGHLRMQSGTINDGTGSGNTLKLVKDGTGTWIIEGANTFSGGVEVNAGILAINSPGALGTGTLTLNSGASINNSSGGNITSSTNNNAQVWNGDFTYVGTRALNLGTGAVTMTDNIQINQNGANSNNNALTIGGAISGAGFGITKIGTGRLFLTGQSTFDGGVNVQVGVIHVDGNSSDFGSGTGPLGIGTLTLNETQLVGSSVTAVNTLQNNIVVNSPNALSNSLTTNGVMTLSGTISGSGNLHSSGNGAVILAGTNSYTGTTRVASGTMMVGSNAPSGADGALGNSTTPVSIDPSGADVGSLLTAGAFAVDRQVSVTSLGTGPVGIGGISNSNSSFNGLVTFARSMSVGQLTGGGTLSVTGGLTSSSATPATLTFGRPAVPAVSPEFFGDVNVDSNITEGAGALGVVVAGGNVTFAAGNTNSYSGTTAVNGGSLVVNGTHSNAGAYTVAAGATLGGDGTIVTDSGAGVTIDGMLSPGNSPGVLSMDLGAGSLDISTAVSGVASASMLFEIGSIGSSDQVQLISGLLNIGTGALEFDDFVFTDLVGFGPGDYTLFDTGSPIAGSLGASLSGTVGGYAASLSLANGGQDLVLSVVPEPGSVFFAASGILGLCLAYRRRLR